MLIQPRRGTSDQWTSADATAPGVVLAVGEMGYETDTKKFKYGDGLSRWYELPYGISTSNLADAGLIGVELLNSVTVEEARTILNIGTGVAVNASDIVDSTTVGRAVLKAASTSAAQDAIGASVVGKAVLVAADAAAARTATGCGTYSKPSSGIPSSDLASAVQTALTAAGTALQSVSASSVSDSTAIGRAVLTAASAAAARSAIGAGTSDLALGTSSTTALAGNYAPTATSISDSTTVGRGLITAQSAQAARAVIGAGTSSLTLGTTSSTALAGNYQPTAANISDATTVGRNLLTAVDAAAVRNFIGVTSTGNIATIAASDITDSTVVGRAVLMAADSDTARQVIGAGTGNYSRPNTGIPSDDLASAVQSALASATTALQTVSSSSLSDATTTGRNLITAADGASARSTIGAGTYTRPVNGIPFSDLATGVQGSLNKADSALQTVASANITDATTTGRSLLTAIDNAAVRTAIGAGNYTRPSNGIPLTDLASAVQASLGRADSALQSVSSTSITDSTQTGRNLLTAASASAVLTLIGAGNYTRPSGGIPSSDLTTSVQASLTLANSALQAVPSGYVLGSSAGTATTLTLWVGTAAQYAAIGTKSSTTVYVVT